MLARGGHEVVFLARGKNLEALRTVGLTIESIDGNFRVPATATETLVGWPSVDCVLVTAKSYDTTKIARLIAPVITPATVVLSLQNGVENEAVLAAELDLPPLLGAMTHVAAELVAPGVVRHTGEGEIFFGEITGHESPRSHTLAAMFASAGVAHRASHDILVRLWNKLAWNAAHNAVTALTRSTAGQAATHPTAGPLIRDAMHEVGAVARARGIPLDSDRVEDTMAFSREHLRDLRTSMLQDVERGGRLEHEALNGAVVRLGTAASVPTPINRVLYDLLGALDSALRSPQD